MAQQSSRRRLRGGIFGGILIIGLPLAILGAAFFMWGNQIGFDGQYRDAPEIIDDADQPLPVTPVIE